jgi:hypothetical protein
MYSWEILPGVKSVTLQKLHTLPSRVISYFHISLYLPGTGTEVNHDHKGGSLRARLSHCTAVGLTPAIVPNVGNSST